MFVAEAKVLQPAIVGFVRKFVVVAIMFSVATCGMTSLAPSALGQDEEIPEPEAITLETKDGLLLRCTWYAGTAEKKSVPIIMIHGWDGEKEDLAHLALEMQKLGHSVIVPDMRGHGGSVTYRGIDEEIDREKMNKAGIAQMTLDIEACKKFLMEKNDEGKLNIDMLSVVATRELCIVAAEWALADWSFPDLGGRRQGRDVKALVFLSPERRFKGLTLVNALRNPLFTGRGAVPFSLVVAAGDDDQSARREARTIHSALEKTRPELDLDGKTDEERNRIITEKQDLFLWTFDVEYQGTDLVHAQAPLGLPRNIGNFLYYRLVAKEADYPWQVRGRQ